MNSIIKYTNIFLLILSVGFSQVGVLIYEVYCQCKKETDISIHLPISNCEALHAEDGQVSCCSADSGCSKDDNKKKPCSKEAFKLFQLDSAKLSAEKNVDLDDIQSNIHVFDLASQDHKHIISSYIQYQDPPDSTAKNSVFDQHTFIYIQSFLC